MIIFIDIGGTPASILKNNKFELALANNISKEKLIAIVDPFDLSRAERKISLKNRKIKIPIKVKNVNISSDCITPNLRKFMNNLIKLNYPDLKIIKLEKILSENKTIIYNLLKEIEIPVRAICPKCNQFKKIILGNKTPCCNISGEKIINSGRYLPQTGFLCVITYLCGYKTYSNDAIKIEQVKKIMNKLNLKGNPIKTYIKLNEFNQISKGKRK